MKPYGPLATFSMQGASISSGDFDLLMSLPGTKYNPGSRTFSFTVAENNSSLGTSRMPVSPSGRNSCATNPQKKITIPATIPPSKTLPIADSPQRNKYGWRCYFNN